MRYNATVLEVITKPLSRSSHGISFFKNKLYLFGGENVARVPIGSELHCLDVSDKSNLEWKSVAVSEGMIPSPRVAHSQAIVNDTIYIFGGRQGVHMSEAPLNDMYRIKLSEEVLFWEKVEAKGDIPSERSFHGMCSGKSLSGNDAIFIFGGCGASGRLNDVYMLDVISLEWTKLPSFDKISGRGGASFFYSNNFLYVVCGFIGSETNDAYSLNLETKSWREEKITGKFRPRSVCAHTSIDVSGTNYLAIFGGEVNPSEKGHEGAGGFANDLLLLPISSATGELETVVEAELLGSSVSSRGWTMMTPDNEGSKLYIYGGLTGSDENPVRLDDLVCLDIH